MNIYLIRHGEAEPSTDLKTDKERELTPEGLSVLKSSMMVWKSYQNHFDLIISSPLKRARQTAELIKEFFHVSEDIVTDFSLLNGGQTKDLLFLAESLGFKEIAMVGHQPDIGKHIANIVGAIDINFQIKPAAIVKLSFAGNPKAGRGKLEFLIPPIIKKG